MEAFWWITAGGIGMSAIALVGGVTLLLRPAVLDHLLVPLVALAAGSLLGGAFFHMLPDAIEAGQPAASAFAWTMLGFSLFFAMEQGLHWHHCRRSGGGHRQPRTWLILIGDGLHNFLGGLGVGAAFLVDIRLGVTAWLVAAAHEIPQELGDFGVLVQGGWKKGHALIVNGLCGLTFLFGGLLAWAVSDRIDTAFLVPFAAGNFIYLGAADLIPELKDHEHAGANVVNFAAFAAGLLLLWWLSALS